MILLSLDVVVVAILLYVVSEVRARWIVCSDMTSFCSDMIITSSSIVGISCSEFGGRVIRGLSRLVASGLHWNPREEGWIVPRLIARDELVPVTDLCRWNGCRAQVQAEFHRHPQSLLGDVGTPIGPRNRPDRLSQSRPRDRRGGSEQRRPRRRGGRPTRTSPRSPDSALMPSGMREGGTASLLMV